MSAVKANQRATIRKSARAGYHAPVMIRRYAERPSLSYLTREVGITGGVVEEGVSLQNYHAALSGPEWFRKVDEMLLASSQAAVVELAVSLPIVTAQWSLRGGAAELRGLCETSLFGTSGMSTTWPEVVYNACAAALYGTAVMEIVWKEVDGALLVRRLMDRDQTSVAEYVFDPDGGLSGIVQKGTDPDSGEPVEVTVKIEKVLLFPYRLRRREYHGRSILRPAYRHYESIAMLCTFADIGLDHSMVGLPVGKSPQGAKQADLDTFRAILMAMRRHEASGLVLPPGWDLVDGRQAGADDQVGFLDYLQWHEGCFLRAALAGFMQLGSTATGTTEIGSAQMAFSLMAWSALADMIAGVINRHLIRRICDYTTTAELPESAYPELVVQPMTDVFKAPGTAGRYLAAVAAGEEELPAEPEQAAQAMTEGLRLRQPERGGLAFAERDVQRAVAAVKADGAQARDTWSQQMTPRMEALLAALLRQIDLADGEAERLAEVAAPGALVDDIAAGMARFVADVRRVAAARMAEETGAAAAAERLAEEPTQAELAKGRNLADHLAESARFAVVGAALRGEDLTDLASRFTEAVNARLRVDLQAAAAEQVDG